MASSKFGSKFLGEERYQQYVDELTAEGTIDGEPLSSTERKEGFKKRNDNINFQNFIEKVLERKEKASVSGAGGGALVKRPSSAIQVSKIVPETAPDGGILEEILKIVTSIRDTLIDKNKFDVAQSKKDRQFAERKRRGEKENKLESNTFAGLTKGVNKVLAPVKGLFEKVFDFIKTVVLGRVVVTLIKWFTDDENKEKVEAIGTFLKKTWPALLAAYLLFGNSLGRFVTKIVFMIGKFTAKLLKKGIPKLLKLIAANPLASAALAIVTAATIGGIRQSQTPSNDPEAEPGQTQLDDTQDFGGITGAPISADMLGFGQYSGGGMTPMGTDTVPAMLTPGEFVMSRGAVNTFGSDFMETINAAGGGTNQPKGGYYSSGGSVSDKEEPGGRNKTGTEKPKPNRNILTSLFGGRSRNNKDEVASSWKSVLDLIAKYEAVNGSYDSIYPSSIKPGLSQMTIEEADNLQSSTASSRGSAAAGRYQFMYIKNQAAAAGIAPDEKFSPENQDKMAIHLIEGKRGITYDMMKNNPNEAMIRLGMEWASLPMPIGMQGHRGYVQAGQSYYAGDGRNAAHASIQEVRDAMRGISPAVGEGSSSGTIAKATSSGSVSSSTGSTATATTTKTQTAPLPKFNDEQLRKDLGVRTASVSKSSRPSSTSAYSQMQGDTSQAAQIQNSNNDASGDVPSFEAAAMSSPKKIKTLGITV